jgi:hypothetical protein
MTRYDWSKLDPGWAFDQEYRAVHYETQVLLLVQWLEEPERAWQFTGSLLDYAQQASAQLAKCRIHDGDTRNEKILAQTEWALRIQDEVSQETADTRYWQALTEENERLKTELTRYQLLARESEQSRSISESQVKRLTEQIRKLQEKPSDWRDEVKQSLKGNDGGLVLWDVSDTLLRISPNMVHHDTFYVSCSNTRTYALTEGVRKLEDVLRLSLVIERLKKLGWTEAK